MAKRVTKTPIESFVVLVADKDKNAAVRIVKVLKENGIDSMEALMLVQSDELLKLKGIGMNYLKIIDVVRTRQRMTQKPGPDFRDYLIKAGCTKLESFNLEHIVKAYCNTIDDFIKQNVAEMSSWIGVGPKRHEKLIEAKRLIEKDRKKYQS